VRVQIIRYVRTDEPSEPAEERPCALMQSAASLRGRCLSGHAGWRMTGRCVCQPVAGGQVGEHAIDLQADEKVSFGHKMSTSKYDIGATAYLGLASRFWRSRRTKPRRISLQLPARFLAQGSAQLRQYRARGSISESQAGSGSAEKKVRARRTMVRMRGSTEVGLELGDLHQTRWPSISPFLPLCP
jgi:hypothetical protein